MNRWLETDTQKTARSIINVLNESATEMVKKEINKDKPEEAPKEEKVALEKRVTKAVIKGKKPESKNAKMPEKTAKKVVKEELEPETEKSIEDQIADLQDYLDNTPEIAEDEKEAIQAEIDGLISQLGEKDLELNESIDVDKYVNKDKEFKYKLLSRLQSDCDYFLGAGNRAEKHLWANNVKDQITLMKALYNSFSEEDRPEWITLDKIEEYEKEMKDNTLEEAIDTSEEFFGYSLEDDIEEYEGPVSFDRFLQRAIDFGVEDEVFEKYGNRSKTNVNKLVKEYYKDYEAKMNQAMKDNNLTEDTTEPAVFEIDYADDGDGIDLSTEESVIDAVRNWLGTLANEVKIEVPELNGPAGGWPVVRLTGNKEKIAKFLLDNYNSGAEETLDDVYDLYLKESKLQEANFSDKVSAIKKSLKKRDKRLSNKTAEQSAKNIAGAMAKKESMKEASNSEIPSYDDYENALSSRFKHRYNTSTSDDGMGDLDIWNGGSPAGHIYRTDDNKYEVNLKRRVKTQVVDTWQDAVKLLNDSVLNKKESMKEEYSEKFGGDPKDFISDLISVKYQLSKLNLDSFGSHLARQMVEDFIDTCDRQIEKAKRLASGDEFYTEANYFSPTRKEEPLDLVAYEPEITSIDEVKDKYVKIRGDFHKVINVKPEGDKFVISFAAGTGTAIGGEFEPATLDEIKRLQLYTENK